MCDKCKKCKECKPTCGCNEKIEFAGCTNPVDLLCTVFTTTTDSDIIGNLNSMTGQDIIKKLVSTITSMNERLRVVELNSGVPQPGAPT